MFAISASSFYICPMQFEYQDLLKKELEERIMNNSNYSLRAFARDLGMSPASLSQIMRKQRGLSEKRARLVAKILKLDFQDQKYFQYSVLSQHAKNPLQRNRAALSLKKIMQKTRLKIIEAEQLNLLADWRTLTLLEAIHLENFKPDISSIAQKLNIPLNEVTSLVNRLEKVGLLKIHPHGEWEDMSPALSTTDGPSSKLVRQFHRDILKKAEQSLEIQDTTERYSQAVILCLDDEQLQMLRSILQSAIDKTIRIGTEEKSKNNLYCMSIQLFNLLHKENT